MVTDIKNFLASWINAGNKYSTEEYLHFYLPDAVLDDLSVGRKFKGHKGVKEYFERYFIEYQTQTEKVNVIIRDDEHAHLEVAFTGNFPEGTIGGIFDLTFREGKIAFVKADLVH